MIEIYFLKIRSKFNHSKAHLISCLYFFLKFMFKKIYVSYVDSLWDILKWNDIEDAFEPLCITVHDSTSNVHYYFIFDVYLLSFITMYVFLFKWAIIPVKVFATLMILLYVNMAFE
jgi:RNAse (barnase) inhibitor barstar